MPEEKTPKSRKIQFELENLAQIASLVQADCIVEIRNKSHKAEDWYDLNLDVLKELDISSDDIFSIKLIRGDVVIEEQFTKHNLSTQDSIVSDVISNLISNKHITQNDRLLVVTDDSISSKYNSAIFIIDVDRVLYRIGKFNLAKNMVSETILEAVLEVSQEIALEGREGKKIGALFVIGDEEELEKYTRQLIINPFKGYDKEFSDIQNVSLRETIKNFAQLDGSFIINNEGQILSAGTYIDVDTSNIKAYAGWGTKHLAAVAITKETDCVSVLVSESGGRIKVFKDGKLMLRI